MREYAHCAYSRIRMGSESGSGTVIDEPKRLFEPVSKLADDREGAGVDPIALYYPYIHVRDEAWLKYAALYWPKMGRLRPPDYGTTDSPVAQMLKRE
jgi:hypothetical protein